MRGLTLVLYIMILVVRQFGTCILNKKIKEYSTDWIDPSLRTALEITKKILSGPLKERSVTLLTERHTEGGNQITNNMMNDDRTQPMALLRFSNYSKDPIAKKQLANGVGKGLDNITLDQQSPEFGSFLEIGSLIIITTSEDELWWPFHSQSLFAKDLILISPWTSCLSKNFFETPLLSRISFVALICPSKGPSLNDNGTDFRVWTYRPYAEVNQLFNLGLWTTEAFRSWNYIFINRFDDMTNKNMYIPVNPKGVPFVASAADGSVTGVSYKIMDALSSALQFKLTMNSSRYFLWGFMREKLRTGESDLFINSNGMTLKAYREFDLLRPYFSEGAGIMLKIPPPLPRWKNILNPFSWTVWAAVVFSMICTSVVYHYLRYEYDKSFISNALDILQFMLSNAMTFIPKEWRIRSFLLLYWIASYVIHMSYTCNLIAVLTVPEFPRMLETVEELANSNLRLCMLEYGSHLPVVLRTSTNPVVSKIGHALDMVPINFTLDADGQEACEENLLKGTHAHIDGSSYINLLYDSFGHRAQVYSLKEQLHPGYNVFLAKKYTPWSYIINQNMQRIIESGLIQKWHDEEMKKSRKEFLPRTSGEPQPFVLDHLQGSFYLVIGGTIISALALAKEVVEASYFSSQLDQLS